MFTGLQFSNPGNKFQIFTFNSIINEAVIILEDPSSPKQNYTAKSDPNNPSEPFTITGKLPDTLPKLKIIEIRISYKLDNGAASPFVNIEPRIIHKITLIEPTREVTLHVEDSTTAHRIAIILLLVAIAVTVVILLPTLLFVAWRILTQDAQDRSPIKWMNLLRFIIGFSNFWSDILFSFLVYQKWKNQEDLIFFILFILTVVIIVGSWIDQLV